MADEDFHALLRTQGTQATRLGSDLESRFWLSYRPYESKDGARDWFIGPELTWLHSQDDRIAGVTQGCKAAATCYSSELRLTLAFARGMHLWLRHGLGCRSFHAARSSCPSVVTSVLFRITQQFRLHL